MKDKIQIHQFDPVIYPFKIWITIGITDSQLKSNFCNLDYSEISYNLSKGNYAITDDVRYKETNHIGALIDFMNKKQITMKNVSHESSHAAKLLFEYIGADMRQHEPFEYLVGWIADCCEQVRKNKFK